MTAGLHLLTLRAVQFAIAGVVIAAAIAIARRFRKRPEQEEVERQRRILVNQSGRIADGVISDINEDTIYFTYCVHGVDYQATQFVGSISELIPPEPHRLIGPVTVKYLSRNPANSIVVCEKWSGLRKPLSE